MYQTFNKSLKFDQRSVTAKNLRNIADKCNKDLNIKDKRIVKNCMIFQEIPVEEEWRIPFSNELISAKKQTIRFEKKTKLDINVQAEAQRSYTHAALNYNTEKEHLLATALGP